MAIITFFASGLGFDAGSTSATNNFLRPLGMASRPYSAVFNNASQWVVALDTSAGGVSYVGFFPSTTFVPGPPSQKIPPFGIVEAIVLYDSGGAISAIFEGLTELQLHAENFIATPTLLTSGDDDFLGSVGADHFVAGAGDDIAFGDDGNDTLWGGDGDDFIIGGGGADNLRGDAGIDTVYYLDALAGVTVNLATGVTSGATEADSVSGFENVIGSDFDDTLIGNDEANILVGALGADMLDGRSGADAADYIDSASGVTVNLATGVASGGSAEGDTLISIENLSGSDFADVLTGDAQDNVIAGADGNDILDGGAGFDTADYSDASGGVLVALYKQAWVVKNQTPGPAGSDVLTNFEALQGSAFDDYLLGSDAGDELRGGAGDDEVESFAGADTLNGEDGDDLLIAGDGADSLSGGEGDDFLSGQLGDDSLYGDTGGDALAGGAGNDTLSGGGGRDRMFGGDGNDVIDTGDGDSEIAYGDAGDDHVIASGTGSVEVQGGFGNDIIEVTGSKRIEAFGEDDNDTIRGGAADDYVSAGDGDDFLYGNGGADRLIGGAGDDTIEGGAGDDFLWGFAGADRFVFTSGFTAGQFDTIRDFEDGIDKIVLPAALQNAVTISSSAFGSFVSVATPQGQIGILVEDIAPANLSLGGDFLFG